MLRVCNFPNMTSVVHISSSLFCTEWGRLFLVTNVLLGIFGLVSRRTINTLVAPILPCFPRWTIPETENPRCRELKEGNSVPTGAFRCQSTAFKPTAVLSQKKKKKESQETIFAWTFRLLSLLLLERFQSHRCNNPLLWTKPNMEDLYGHWRQAGSVEVGFRRD